MFKITSIACVMLGLLSVSGQVSPRTFVPGDFRAKQGPGPAVHLSLSGQFVVREPENAGGYPIPLGRDTSVKYIRVDPTLLAVSCERIKHAFLAEMDAPDRWQDRIYIDLQRARTLNDQIVIASSPFGRNWSYHVSLPDTVENTRLVTCVVDILLLEMANRQTNRSTEIPAWLGLGFCQDIMRSAHVDLVLEPAKPNALGMNIIVETSGTNTNSMAVAHEELRVSTPLTLEQLSWPDENQLEGAAGQTFRSSAQLFVHELLQLHDGHAAMRAFIQELPQHLNWQLSFLHAFRGNFANQLELEKWWALRLVDFTGRDVTQNWTAEESFQKLDAILHPAVEVRTRANEMPMRTQLPLQTIIAEWDGPKQAALLEEKSKQLYMLRSHVSQELAKLTDDYRRTIDVYLKRRGREGYLRTGHAQSVLGLEQPARDAINDLNVLDSIREDIRPKPQTLQSTAAIQGINH